MNPRTYAESMRADQRSVVGGFHTATCVRCMLPRQAMGYILAALHRDGVITVRERGDARWLRLTPFGQAVWEALPDA